MTQVRDHWVTAEDMVRSRAWRQGYESFRLGDAPEFDGRGRKSLAYEYGRLTAAYLQGRGQHLRRVSPARPLNEHYVPDLAVALTRCLEENADALPGAACGSKVRLRKGR